MDKMMEAQRRVALAREMKRVPLKWIADAGVVAELDAGGTLAGLPLEIGQTRFGLELIIAPR